MTKNEYKNLKRGDKLRANHNLYRCGLVIKPGTILTFLTKSKFDPLNHINNSVSFKEYGVKNKWWCGLIDIYKPIKCPEYLRYLRIGKISQ